MNKGNYRDELNGIRAFAVSSATAYQFLKSYFPSGYLGVDIFAVLSGYVITASLKNRSESEFKSYASSFYKRRIKRLLPGLTLAVFGLSILTMLFNPLPVETIKTGIASLFGLSSFFI